MTDREKAIKVLECLADENAGCYTDCPYYADSFRCFRKMAADALALLREQEPVEQDIVRCKDCKYWKNKYKEYDVHPWLPCMEIDTSENWFCGYGERR